MYEFVDKWSNNPIVRKKVKEYLPSYLAQFELVDQPIICKLLKEVEYYNEDVLNEITECFFNIIDKLRLELPGTNKICSPIQDDFVNHNTLKLLSWAPKRIEIINNILKYDLLEIDNLIIIDDYCGSGEKILDLLKKIDEKITKKLNVYYCPIFIINQTIDNLKNKKFEYINFYLISNKINKAMCLSTNNIFNDEEKVNFIRICDEKSINMIYGYNDSEDKFATKYFTPNNSLGILWYSERLYKPLFGRNGRDLCKNYRFLSNKQIKEFNETIIHGKTAENIMKAKFALLLYNNYNVDEIEKFLGINNGDKIIESLLNENVLKISNNRYMFDKNLKKYFRIEKISLYVEFGEVITKQDEIENNLRSLIA